MSDIYYNTYEFQKVVKLDLINPFEAKKQFEYYLEKYPMDYGAYAFYASNLVKLGKYEDAEKILDYVEQIITNDDKFQSNLDKMKHVKKNLLFSRVKLLMNQEKYDECYYSYLQNKEDIKSIKLNAAVIFYCREKLGLQNPKNKKYNSYIFRQISHYEEQEFKEHIKKHMADYAKDMEIQPSGIFLPEFPVDEVILEIKKNIPSSKRICTGFYVDEYTFKYDMNGRSDYKMTNYFKAICFHNTCDFITMTPALDCENLPYVDLNYLVKKEDTKVKRLSQIDKFYQKYKNYK